MLTKGISATTAILLVGGAVMAPLPLGEQPEKANASTLQNIKATTGVIALENGDFENPSLTLDDIRAKGYAQPAADTVPGWQTTDSSGSIQMFIGEEHGFPAAASGRQYVELNNEEVAALYQDVDTTPGVKVRWTASHKGRKGTDVALVEFGAPGGSLVQQVRMSDGTGAWGVYTGEYVIPEGQTTTRFQFRAVSSAGAGNNVGNYLDNIQFATQSVLQLDGSFSKESTKVNKSVDYNVKVTNVGGMTAANNKITVKIPTELTYKQGDLTSTNTSITNEKYNAATGELTFEISKLIKDKSANIVIPMTGATIADAALPDTSATFNDENFNDDIYTVDATDEAVAVTSNEVPVITGDTETTVAPNSSFDPMSSMKATDKEDGDITNELVVVDNPVDVSKSGTYEVKYEVTDADGNKSTFTRTVVVTAAPIITGESETRVNPNESFDPMTSMKVTDQEDGDITEQLKVVSNSVDTSKPGSYEVKYEVADADGNKATFTRTVVVTEAPIITGDTATKVNPNSDFDPMSSMKATDKEDGNITSAIKIVSNSVDTSKPGSYKVGYEVIDADGNKATFTRTVVVTEAPIITGETETKVNPNSEFNPMSSMEALDKEDGDLTSQIEVVSNSVDTSQPGTYEVTYQITDADGNIDTFTRAVIVTEAPIITGETSIRLNPNTDFDPMSVLESATDKEDGDLMADVQVIYSDVDTSMPGNYSVVFEVSDADGNKTTFTTDVVVTAAPSLTGEENTTLNPNAVFNPMSTMSATDVEDGDLTPMIEVVSSNVDTTKSGTYEVTYEVTDADGNKATFTRTVVVTEVPIITGEAETKVNPNTDFNPMSSMKATDKEDGNITSAIKVVSNSVDTSKSGSYKVVYEVTDADGNKATFTRTVIVTEAPIITGDTEAEISQGDSFDALSGITAQDEEDGDITSSIQILSNNVNRNVPGTYEVTYEVMDSDGNIAQFTRTVKVNASLIVVPAEDNHKAEPAPTKTESTIIKAPEKAASLPKTGDTSNASVLWGLCLTALAGVFFWRRNK